MAAHSKKENDLYGEAFEKLLVNKLGGHVALTEAELGAKIEDRHVSMAAEILGNKFGTIRSVEHIGKQVKNANADIKINGLNIEVKYVSGGTGTYWNTSMDAVTDFFGLESYPKNHIKEVRDFLYPFFGDSVYRNVSPVTLEQSHEFRHNHKDKYEQLKRVEFLCRDRYVHYLAHFFGTHPDKVVQLYDMILSKGASNKQAPDYLFVYNYDTKCYRFCSKEDLVSKSIEFNFTESQLGFIIGNFRVAVAWQNGTGLNNPTIRCFLL